jgi:hypothetical protein
MGILKRDSKQQPDIVPAGMKTTEQWAKEEQLSVPHASRLIRGLVADGKWESRKFRLDTTRGLYPILHHGPKKK